MIFIDMDGVLAVCGPDQCYMGCPPPFAVKGAHFFADRPVDENAMSFMEELRFASPRKNIAALTTLTKWTTVDASVAREHKLDKSNWLNVQCKEHGIAVPVLLFATEGALSKSKAASLFLGRELDRCDILVDDFNYNLLDWSKHGGTAIKWLNGFNSIDSWDGPAVSATTWRAAIPHISKMAHRRPKKNRSGRTGSDYIWNLV